MKKVKVLLSVMFIFLGCSLKDTIEQSEIESSETLVFDSTIEYEELSHGAFIGGSLVYDEINDEVNQLSAGMVVRLRIDKYNRLDPSGKQEYNFGIMNIRAVHPEWIAIDYIFYNDEGRECINEQNVVITNGGEVNFNGDNYSDLRYTSEAPGGIVREGMENSCYLEFLYSEDESYARSLYMLDVMDMEYGVSDFSLTGINPSGNVIVQISTNLLTGLSQTGDTSASLTISSVSSFIPEVGDLIVDGVNSTYYEVDNISISGSSYSMGMTKITNDSPYELIYMDIVGYLDELNSKYRAHSFTYNGSSTSAGIEGYITLSPEEVMDFLDLSPEARAKAAEIMPPNAGMGIEFSVYVAAVFDKGVGWCSGAITTTVYLHQYAEFYYELFAIGDSKDDEIPLFDIPPISIPIGPILLTFSMPISIGYEIGYSAAGYFGLGYDKEVTSTSSIGFGIGLKPDRNYFYKNKDSFETTENIIRGLEIDGRAWAMAYVSVKPRLSIYGTVHAGLDIKPYVKAEAVGHAEFGLFSRSGYFTFDVDLGLRADLFVGVGWEKLGIYKDWSTPGLIDISANLYHFDWDSETPQIASDLGQVQNLNLSLNNYSGKIDLSWDNVVNSTGYNIYRLTNGIVERSFYVSGTKAEDFSDLQADVEYTYQVGAFNNMLIEGALSAPKTITIPSPSAPTSLTVSPKPAGWITLSWPDGINATSYKIYRTAPGLPDKVFSTKYTTFNDMDMIPGVNYNYEVSSVSWVGESVSGTSGSGSPILPSVPNNFGIKGMTTRNVLFDWESIAGAVEYRVQRTTDGDTADITEFFTTYSELNDTTIDYDTTYYYKVMGVNYAGDGDFTTNIMLTTASTNDPEVIVDNLTNNQILDMTDTNFTVTGTAWTGSVIPSDKVYFSFDNGVYIPIEVGADGTWSYNFDFPYGVYDLKFFTVDDYSKVSFTNVMQVIRPPVFVKTATLNSDYYYGYPENQIINIGVDFENEQVCVVWSEYNNNGNCLVFDKNLENQLTKIGGGTFASFEAENFGDNFLLCRQYFTNDVWPFSGYYAIALYNNSVNTDYPLMIDTDFIVGKYAIDENSYIYATEAANITGFERICKTATNGNTNLIWGSGGSDDGEFNSGLYGNPIAYCDKNSYLYVADTENYRVQIFDTNGVFITKWGEYGVDFKWISAIAVDDFFVYITQTNTSQGLYLYTHDGSFVDFVNTTAIGLPNYQIFDLEVGNDLMFISTSNICKLEMN